MNWTRIHRCGILLAVAAASIMLTSISAEPAAGVMLSEGRFHGLTRIVVITNAPLAGITPAHIVITRPDGKVVPPEKITGIETTATALSVAIDADQFARITSNGTSIATRAFGPFGASNRIVVQKPGEPPENGHVIGTSSGLDEGWNSLRTDRNYVDPVTGEKGLYSITDVTPDRDEKGNPVDWNDGRITTPAYKSKTMLVLFVEFADRLAANAGAPYMEQGPYLDFVQGAAEWFHRASYGQFRFSLASPQAEKKLGWIMMSRKATEYRAGGSTVPMYAYVGEACQLAYDKWGIKADDYDLLLVMPAKGTAGFSNGPTYIHHKASDGDPAKANRVAFVDRDKNPHYIDTAITAGNDLWRWGYRWAIHESGHTFGLPDLYSYGTTINGVRVGSFFFCGGWDMMGNIAGHSTDFLAWHKWKLHWIRDDQVDVVSQAALNPTKHSISPVETPGGTKMVVVRTGLSTAYVAEFRTRQGINALDGRGKYSGVLIYRIDATRSGARGVDYTGQVISRKYYRSTAVGGPGNLTGLWRSVDNGLDGYDSAECCWQPGDVFFDPATGVGIRVDGIAHCNPADPSGSPYGPNDVAAVTVTKSMNAELFKTVVLSHARLDSLTDLTFDTNVELQNRIPSSGIEPNARSYVREDSRLDAMRLVITRAGGSVIPAAQIVKIVIKPGSVQVTLAKDTFRQAGEARGATVATRPYYHFGPGAPVPIETR